MKDIEIPLKRSRVYRLLEMLPGMLSISLLLLPVVLSLVSVRWAVYFLVFYVTIWFVRSMAMSLRLLQGFMLMRRAMSFDWSQALHDLDSGGIDQSNGDRWTMKMHSSNAAQYLAFGSSDTIAPGDVKHCIIIAVSNETEEVLRPTIQSLIESTTPLDQFDICIAYEERGGSDVKAMCKQLKSEYQPVFSSFTLVEHPDGLPNEVKGKGGNITYAGYKMLEYYKKSKTDTSKVLVTTLDSDNRPDKQYFQALTYTFLTSSDRQRKSYQPMAVYTNNIWDVPAAMRVIASGNSFWWILVSTRRHLMRNFSAHSQPLDGLVETDFWSVRTVVEDGHQYWRSYFAFDGDYDVVPIRLAIYQDAVLSESYGKTIKAQFTQLRRWAYGASDIPYVATNLFKSGASRWETIGKLLRLIENHVSWATASIMIAFSGLTPLYLGGSGSQDIEVQKLPIFVSRLTTFSLLGVLVTFALTLFILPRRPSRYGKGRYVFLILQWGLLPVVSLLYMSLAAFNSQIRLILGRYLNVFDVTEKHVKGESGKSLD